MQQHSRQPVGGLPVSALDESVVRMINQIGANFGYLSPGEAAAETADHVRRFWTPSMREHLLAQVSSGTADLTPVALEAARLI